MLNSNLIGEGENQEMDDIHPKNDQTDSAVPSDMLPSDFPAKKLARQLEFSGSGGAVLTQHPHSQSQSQGSSETRTLAVVQSQLQPKCPQNFMVFHVGTQAPHTMRNPESPKSKSISNFETKDATLKKEEQCNCKYSRCLKRYCECFASGIYCDGCNCKNCYNNNENEAARRAAVKAILKRNPNAYRPKIAISPHGAREKMDEIGKAVMLVKHNKGCHCKKSGCLKKYCECFQANILCSENCKCMDCKNFEGSDERRALFNGDPVNNMAHIQQATNATITGAIGSFGYACLPIKKRKGPELCFGPSVKDPSLNRITQFHQATNGMPSAPASSSLPVAHAGSLAASGHSKSSFRSLLADLIQPLDLKELCSVLAVLLSEAAEILADQRITEKQVNNAEQISLALSTEDRSQQQEGDEKAADVENQSINQRDSYRIVHDDPNLDSSEMTKARPMSPRTLALMCDERDTMFIGAAPPNRLAGHGCSTSSHLPDEKSESEVFAEQGRIVLIKFRDCLDELVTLGEMKERNVASSSISEVWNEKHQNKNRNSNGGTEAGCRQRTITDDVMKNVALSVPKRPPVGPTAVLHPGNDMLSKILPPSKNGKGKAPIDKEYRRSP